MSKIITRLFDEFADAEHAVIELERVGVSHGDISLVTNNSEKNHAHHHVRQARDETSGEAAADDAGKGALAGGIVAGAGGLLAGLGILAIPGLGPVVAAGWLASAAAGVIAGGIVGGAAGGLVGALTNAGVSDAEAHVYAEGVRRGGTLVSAKVDDDKIASAEAALSNLRSVDVSARGAAYREGGWRHFDESATPYTEAEAERDRAFRGSVS